MAKRLSTRQNARKHGYRSGLELEVAEKLLSEGIDGQYEENTINYTIPESKHKYTPDFRLPNGIFVETKGRFLAADRKKHLLIKQQHPNIDIRFLFQNSRSRISKKSKTTYADWCNKYGFTFADKSIPSEWYK